MNELETKNTPIYIRMREKDSFKVGDFVEEDYGNYNPIIGQVCYGEWTNVGICDIKKGNGFYIKWDDGDWSMIGFEYVDWSKIKKCDHGFYT